MAKKPAVRVTPRSEEGWAVIREGNDRASEVFPTQAQAERAGRNVARRDQTEFFLHGQDGRIRERDSYGNDPHPPKG